jgi:hypothetical protein
MFSVCVNNRNFLQTRESRVNDEREERPRCRIIERRSSSGRISRKQGISGSSGSMERDNEDNDAARPIDGFEVSGRYSSVEYPERISSLGGGGGLTMTPFEGKYFCL